MNRNIHIVCLDAPSPPDYGGAIDMFYKIKALGEAGNRITLHYYNYNPNRHTKGLEMYCTDIFTYKRKHFLSSFSFYAPYIVQSRVNKELAERLNSDTSPILLEGLHCAGLVPLIQKKERIILRMHNEESSYYRHLAKTEKSFAKKTYFALESRLLERFQKRVDKAVRLACLSETDMDTFQNRYGFQNLFFLPCFLPWQKVRSQTGRGDYCLYHGNLSVSENEEAAIWLIRNVFNPMDVPFVIAGKGISPVLRKIAKKSRNVRLIDNPPIDEVDALVRDAQINVLPSMNATGVKLKLLNALLNGRFCITNRQGVSGSRINSGLVIADKSDEWIRAIQSLQQQEFTEDHVAERAQILSLYHNLENAYRLSEQWMHGQ